MNYRLPKILVRVALVLFICAPSMVMAAVAPSLGRAKSFAVLGGSTVTNTGSSVITGDLGVWPGSAVTGFPPGLVTGVIHKADAVAKGAQVDLTAAFVALTGQPCNVDLTGQDLGGKTLTSGVYCFDSSAQLTGKLTLNAQGNANAVFIFKMGSTITSASGASVALINGAQHCNVFWQVGSSATIGTTTQFMGNILALTSITMNTGANLNGRALARNGAVTLDTNRIDASQCGGGGDGDGGGGGGDGDDDGDVCVGLGPRIWIADRLIGPPQQIMTGVRDSNSGLKSIVLLRAVNATVKIPAFSQGTKNRVTVTVTKINQSLNASFVLQATNVDNCIAKGDPVMTVLKIPPFGHRVRQSFEKIPLAESFVTIVNGTPGLTSLEVRVNGARYGIVRLDAIPVGSREVSVNVSKLMAKGGNIITLTGYGDPNAKALIVISDSGENLQFVTPEIWMDWDTVRPGENRVWGHQVE